MSAFLPMCFLLCTLPSKIKRYLAGAVQCPGGCLVVLRKQKLWFVRGNVYKSEKDCFLGKALVFFICLDTFEFHTGQRKKRVPPCSFCKWKNRARDRAGEGRGSVSLWTATVQSHSTLFLRKPSDGRERCLDSDNGLQIGDSYLRDLKIGRRKPSVFCLRLTPKAELLSFIGHSLLLGFKHAYGALEFRQNHIAKSCGIRVKIGNSEKDLKKKSSHQQC